MPEKNYFCDISEINHNNSNGKESIKDLDLHKLYNILNELKNEINFIKDVQQEPMNDKEIREIIQNNKRLANQINEIQIKISAFNEEIIENKKEFGNLKNIL